MSKARDLAVVGSVAAQGLNFRNKIINGDCRIDQRNNGASVTANGSGYTYQIDRFYSGGLSGSGVFSVQRVSDAPAGFSNSVRLTVTTADTSLGASEEYGFQQTIEGHNTSDLAWGTSSGSAVTLSFWVKSSLTGTYGVAIRNAGTWNRSYVGQYTVNSANTWEYKTIVITPETSGSWGAGNAASVNVAFDLGAGSNFNGTAKTWNTSGSTRVSGNVSFISTNGATWQITGVQLEKGTAATPFEFRPIGTEDALCKRYFQEIRTYSGVVASGAEMFDNVTLYVPMRAAPSFTQTDATGGGGWLGDLNVFTNNGLQFAQWYPRAGNGFFSRYVKLNAEL